jgi:hypothetical protein
MSTFATGRNSRVPQGRKGEQAWWEWGLRRRVREFKSPADPAATPPPSFPFSLLAYLSSRPTTRGGRPVHRRGGPLACLGYTGPSSDAETWTPVRHSALELSFSTATESASSPEYQDRRARSPATKLESVGRWGAPSRHSDTILDSAQQEWGQVRLIHSVAEGSSSQESTCGTSSGDELSPEALEPLDWPPHLFMSRLAAAEPPGLCSSLDDFSELTDLPPGLPSGPMYRPPAEQGSWQRDAASGPVPGTLAWVHGPPQHPPVPCPWESARPPEISVRAAIMSLEERYQLDGLKQRDMQCTSQQSSPAATRVEYMACDVSASLVGGPDWLQSAFQGGRGRGCGADAASRQSCESPNGFPGPLPPQRTGSGRLGDHERELHARGGSQAWSIKAGPFETHPWCWPGDSGGAASAELGSFSRVASFSNGLSAVGAGPHTCGLSEDMYNVRRLSSQDSAVSFSLWLA